jgi:hypothetical protein
MICRRRGSLGANDSGESIGTERGPGMCPGLFRLWPHIEHNDVASGQPLLELVGGNMLDPVPLTEVLVRQLIHLCPWRTATSRTAAQS